MNTRFLQFKYAGKAATGWHELQNRYPRGRLSKFSQTVFYAVTRKNLDDLQAGKFSVEGYRVETLPGYPTGPFLCCYDNNDNEVGFIFRIIQTKNQFLVEEFYEGTIPPKEVAERYAA